MITIKDLCKKCPKDVRGVCCHMNMVINGHNIVLDNVPCMFLETKTNKCMVYDNREKIAPWCLKGKDMFNKGGLPEGCLYLKENPELEKIPKVHIKDILKDLPRHEQLEIVGKYNHYNNIPFKTYAERLFITK